MSLVAPFFCINIIRTCEGNQERKTLVRNLNNYQLSFHSHQNLKSLTGSLVHGKSWIMFTHLSSDWSGMMLNVLFVSLDQNSICAIAIQRKFCTWGSFLKLLWHAKWLECKAAGWKFGLMLSPHHLLMLVIKYHIAKNSTRSITCPTTFIPEHRKDMNHASWEFYFS